MPSIQAYWNLYDNSFRIAIDKELQPIKHYYLTDPKAVKQAQKAVENQGKANW